MSKQFYVYTLARPDGSVFYVGKGSGDRIDRHEQDARRHPHHTCCNPRKCRTIRKIWEVGGQMQRAIVLETDDEQEAFNHERMLIAFYGRDNLCNLTDGGEGASNPSAETRVRMSAGNRGKIVSIETRARLRAAQMGKTYSAEARAKIGAASKGRVKTPEAIEKIAAAHRGKSKGPPSAEKRARISAALKGRKLPADQMAKLIAANTGRVKSPEERAKLRAANLGKTHTPETLAKLRPLTAQQVNRIRALYATGHYHQTTLGRMFNVSRVTIQNIVTGKTYREIEADSDT